MFSLSQTTGYAIKALSCIAGDCEVKQIRDIAKCTDIPVSYLAKVILRLVKSGMIESKRGNKGGVWLTRKPEDISLLEVSEAVDGEDRFTSCLLGLDSCSDARACQIHEFWKPVRMEIRSQLENTTLADLLAFENHRAQKGECGAFALKRQIR